MIPKASKNSKRITKIKERIPATSASLHFLGAKNPPPKNLSLTLPRKIYALQPWDSASLPQNQLNKHYIKQKQHNTCVEIITKLIIYDSIRLQLKIQTAKQ